jgi:hypothetical protein
MHNIYYDTEKCGLEIVDTLDESGLCYEFNTLLIVRATDTGRLYYAHSSGCSCPCPFEEFSYASAENNNLNEITKESIESFISDLDRFPVSVDERREVVRKVEKLLG